MSNYAYQDIRLVRWDIELLRTLSRPLQGPLSADYINALRELCQVVKGFYIAGIQVGDARQFTVPTDPKLPILYNPEIVDQYDRVKVWEGCLSFPESQIKILRYKYVEVKFRDENWDEKRIVAGYDPPFMKDDGILAQAWQHEIEHMQGDLYFDKAPLDEKRVILARSDREMRIRSSFSVPPVKLADGPLETEVPVLVGG
jgi:peptide deformylase